MALRAVPFALRAVQTPAAVPDEKSSFLLPLNDDKKALLVITTGSAHCLSAYLLYYSKKQLYNAKSNFIYIVSKLDE